MSSAKLLSTTCVRCADWRTKITGMNWATGDLRYEFQPGSVIGFKALDVITEADTRFGGARPTPRTTTTTLSLDLDTFFNRTITTVNPDNINKGRYFTDPVDVPGEPQRPYVSMTEPGRYVFVANDASPYALQSYVAGATFEIVLIHRRGLEIFSNVGSFYAQIRRVFREELTTTEGVNKLIEIIGDMEDACPANGTVQYPCLAVDQGMSVGTSPVIAQVEATRGDATHPFPSFSLTSARVYLPGRHRLRIFDSRTGGTTTCQNLNIGCTDPQDVTPVFGAIPDRAVNYRVFITIDWDQSCPP